MDKNEYGKVILCHAHAEIASDAEGFLAQHRDSMHPDQVEHLEALHRGHANALAQTSDVMR
jgi:hypothetical protein